MNLAARPAHDDTSPALKRFESVRDHFPVRGLPLVCAWGIEVRASCGMDSVLTKSLGIDIEHESFGLRLEPAKTALLVVLNCKGSIIRWSTPPSLYVPVALGEKDNSGRSR